MPQISKRRLRRYELAEDVARELRRQLAHPADWDANKLVHSLLEWINVAGPAAFKAPGEKKGKKHARRKS